MHNAYTNITFLTCLLFYTRKTKFNAAQTNVVLYYFYYNLDINSGSRNEI